VLVEDTKCLIHDPNRAIPGFAVRQRDYGTAKFVATRPKNGFRRFERYAPDKKNVC
jgi:hypothetical protein